MRIIHVIESGGGSADFVLYLIKYLPQYRHLVLHGSRSFARLEEVKKLYKNAEFTEWQHAQREIRPLLDLRAMAYLFNVIKGRRGDMIHLHSSKAGFLGRVVCFLLWHKKVIYTPNGLAFLRRDVTRTRVILYAALEKLGAALIGKVVSCSRSEAEALKAHGVDGVYVNNGTERFSADTSPAGDPLVVATVGRATIQKNPRLFNEIAAYFESDPRYRFVWIGGGELEHELPARNITITGWLTRDKVISEVARAHIYLSTAMWEGLPFAVLEAMVIGKPVVLSNCVGNVDLVDNNGFIYETRDEAIQILERYKNDGSLLAKHAKRSHDFVMENFTVEQMADGYKKIYESF